MKKVLNLGCFTLSIYNFDVIIDSVEEKNLDNEEAPDVVEDEVVNEADNVASGVNEEIQDDLDVPVLFPESSTSKDLEQNEGIQSYTFRYLVRLMCFIVFLFSILHLSRVLAFF